MKKFAVLLIIPVLLSLCACGTNAATNGANQEFLRIHIRANSNLNSDQSVKYAVKNAVVEYLTPHLAEAKNKDDAMAIVKANLYQVEQVANRVLSQNGLEYQSSARLCNEEFPARSYDGVVLTAGVYDALIVNLGTGEGDNWWCVVYPPLCFVPSQSENSGNIVFRWKILEVIKNWKTNR